LAHKLIFVLKINRRIKKLSKMRISGDLDYPENGPRGRSYCRGF